MTTSVAARRRRLTAALVLIVLAGLAFAGGAALGGPEAAIGPATVFAQGEGPHVQDGWQTAVASRYDDYGQPLACGGRLDRDQLGVASRTLPCGTLVAIAYRGRMVHVPVIDRGPFVEGRTWDLTGATAEALRFPGLGEVSWRR
jgi:rare lipoprotein A (peptidoglycan hydrolase)